MKKTKFISVVIVLMLVLTMSIGIVYADAPDEFFNDYGGRKFLLF